MLHVCVHIWFMQTVFSPVQLNNIFSFYPYIRINSIVQVCPAHVIGQRRDQFSMARPKVK